MKILWLSTAKQDIKELFEYILEYNPVAARQVRNRIYDAVNSLTNNPALGRPGRVFGTRELVISKTSYIVAYRVRSDTVEILRVIHGARNWERLFKETPE